MTDFVESDDQHPSRGDRADLRVHVELTHEALPVVVFKEPG